MRLVQKLGLVMLGMVARNLVDRKGPLHEFEKHRPQGQGTRYAGGSWLGQWLQADSQVGFLFNLLPAKQQRETLVIGPR